VQELWDSYRQSSDASGYSFVVDRDETGRVVGYACFGPHALTEGTYDLYWLAVDPQMRGRGIAHQLLARVEEDVRSRGGRLLVVETSSTPAYSAARRVYESCGYRLEAEVHDFYGPGDSLVIYTKDLLPSREAVFR
jgi:D-alanine-D-alanine ligase